MNTFAWNITIKEQDLSNIAVEFDFIENDSETWDIVLFVFWETKIETSKDLLTKLEEDFWELLDYDISISTEDKIELIPFDYDEWIYELATFEWEAVSFEEIRNRFIETDIAFCIREGQISNKFWNKVIKVDFVY